MYVAVALSVLIAIGATFCEAFVERTDFCIETEPTLLIDMDRRVVVPSEKQTKCTITAHTLTVKEKVGPTGAATCQCLQVPRFKGVCNVLITKMSFRCVLDENANFPDLK